MAKPEANKPAAPAADKISAEAAAVLAAAKPAAEATITGNATATESLILGNKAPRSITPLVASRWSEACFTQARHSIKPEAGTPPEDLLDPAYYAHIASKVNAGDIIEIRPADGSYYAEVYVWAKGPAFLQVSLLNAVNRPASAAFIDAAFSIEFVEGPAQHRVIRKSDKAVMAKGFASPEAAQAWLAGNKQLAAA